MPADNGSIAVFKILLMGEVMNGRCTLIQLFVVGVVLAFFGGQGIGASLAVPGKATLRSPEGKVSDSLINFTWEAVPGANWYCLWINDSKGNAFKKWYTAEESGCGLGSGQCSVAGPENLAAGTCQWWVRTWNEALYGKWSLGKTFILGEATPTKTGAVAFDQKNNGQIDDQNGPREYGVALRGADYEEVWRGIPSSNWQYRWTSGASLGNANAIGKISQSSVANSR